MEKDGTLVLKASDGRSTDVYLTDKGRSLSEETVERLIRVENQIYDTWSAEDREAFLRLNRQYMELLQKGIEEL
jgi:DNA-binding MarR family transcriptional regulator